MYGNRVRRLTPKWVDEAVRTRYKALQEPIRGATKEVELLAQEAIEGFESAVRVFEVLRAAVCFSTSSNICSLIVKLSISSCPIFAK